MEAVLALVFVTIAAAGAASMAGRATEHRLLEVASTMGGGSSTTAGGEPGTIMQPLCLEDAPNIPNCKTDVTFQGPSRDFE